MRTTKNIRKTGIEQIHYRHSIFRTDKKDQYEQQIYTTGME